MRCPYRLPLSHICVSLLFYLSIIRRGNTDTFPAATAAVCPGSRWLRVLCAAVTAHAAARDGAPGAIRAWHAAHAAYTHAAIRRQVGQSEGLLHEHRSLDSLLCSHESTQHAAMVPRSRRPAARCTARAVVPWRMGKCCLFERKRPSLVAYVLIPRRCRCERR